MTVCAGVASEEAGLAGRDFAAEPSGVPARPHGLASTGRERADWLSTSGAGPGPGRRVDGVEEGLGCGPAWSRCARLSTAVRFHRSGLHG